VIYIHIWRTNKYNYKCSQDSHCTTKCLARNICLNLEHYISGCDSVQLTIFLSDILHRDIDGYNGLSPCTRANVLFHHLTYIFQYLRSRLCTFAWLLLLCVQRGYCEEDKINFWRSVDNSSRFIVLWSEWFTRLMENREGRVAECVGGSWVKHDQWRQRGFATCIFSFVSTLW